MMLDPFYGVFRPGMMVAKWLNRGLLITECTVCIALSVYKYKITPFEWWEWLIAVFGSLIAIHVFNLVVRIVWNIVVAIVHGTTDADEIIETRERRLARRR